MSLNTNLATEDERAYEFFDSLGGIREKIDSCLSTVTKSMKTLENKIVSNCELVVDYDLPNIGITLNNKLVEIYQEFKEMGIEVFIKKEDDEQVMGLIPGFVFNDLINTVATSIRYDLGQYVAQEQALAEKKNYNLNSKIKNNGFKGKIWKLKALFSVDAEAEFLYTSEEIRGLGTYINQYVGVDEYINKFNLKDDLVECLAYSLVQEEYTDNEIDELFGYIREDMAKLGMEDKIPEIKKQVIEMRAEKEKDAKPWDLTLEQKQAANERTNEQNSAKKWTKKEEERG